jgi:hypothetical protein
VEGRGLTESFGHGHGFQQPVDGTNPAAGSSYTHSLKGVFISRLRACVFTLTTDANAANRYVTVEYQGSDGTPFCVNAAAVTVSANSTQRFAGSVRRGVAEWAANTDVLFPLEDVYLEGGNVLKINVASIQVGDTLTLIRFVFDRFPTGEALLPDPVAERSLA